MTKNSVLTLSKDYNSLIVSTDNASVSHSLIEPGLILGLFHGQLSISSRSANGVTNGTESPLDTYNLDGKHLFIHFDQNENHFLIGTSDIDASLTGSKTFSVPATVYSLKDKNTLEIWRVNDQIKIKFHAQVPV
jgi:hypothetical protein